jgi:hypothetical protein
MMNMVGQNKCKSEPEANLLKEFALNFEKQHELREFTNFGSQKAVAGRFWYLCDFESALLDAKRFDLGI